MSTAPDPEFDLDQLFLPAWAKKAPEPNRYAHHPGEAAGRDQRRKDRSDRSARRPEPGRGTEARAGKPFGAPRSDRSRWDRRSDRREQPPPRPPPSEPLPELNIAFVPDEKGVDSLAKQIRRTGRAYPLFGIAQMVLAKPERFAATLAVRKKADGQVAQPLYLCAVDETLWLSEDEAVQHVLDKHFALFYQADRVQVEPPRGTYTFVAQCGLTGEILGPPNYHDYQNRLRKLHAEKFSGMPFDVFKSKVKIVKAEAVVKQWLEEQSWKTEYVCLNMPEPLRLATREEVERHFRQNHLANMVKPVESFHVSGQAANALRSPRLQRLFRHLLEEQRRFPLQMATVLSQQFAARGLQFFKVNKTVTHVAAARPNHLDLEAAPVSEGVKRIIHFISAHPRCTHRQLLEALAAGANPVAAEPTPEQTAVLADLHWLVHQGHVIEFADGVLETAKKPMPRPSKGAPASAVRPSADASQPAAEGSPGPSGGEAEAPVGAAASPEPADSSDPMSGRMPLDGSQSDPVPSEAGVSEETPAAPAAPPGPSTDERTS